MANIVASTNFSCKHIGCSECIYYGTDEHVHYGVVSQAYSLDHLAYIQAMYNCYNSADNVKNNNYVTFFMQKYANLAFIGIIGKILTTCDDASRMHEFILEETFDSSFALRVREVFGPLVHVEVCYPNRCIKVYWDFAAVAKPKHEKPVKYQVTLEAIEECSQKEEQEQEEQHEAMQCDSADAMSVSSSAQVSVESSEQSDLTLTTKPKEESIYPNLKKKNSKSKSKKTKKLHSVKTQQQINKDLVNRVKQELNLPDDSMFVYDKTTEAFAVNLIFIASCLYKKYKTAYMLKLTLKLCLALSSESHQTMIDNCLILHAFGFRCFMNSDKKEVVIICPMEKKTSEIEEDVVVELPSADETLSVRSEVCAKWLGDDVNCISFNDKTGKYNIISKQIEFFVTKKIEKVYFEIKKLTN